MKSITLFFLIIFLGYACTSKNEAEVSPKMKLIQELLEDPNVQYAKNREGKLIISTSNYCATNDCEGYFKEYEDVICLYGKSDIFMRNIRNFIEIVAIDERNGVIQINKMSGWKTVRGNPKT